MFKGEHFGGSNISKGLFNTALLSGWAAYLQAIIEYPGITGYQFDRNGQTLWVLWSIEDTPKTIDLPTNPQAIYDVFGNPLPISQTVEVSNSVTYIEFAP